MRVLITGIAGFAGSHLADYLVGCAELEVFGIVHSSDRNIAHLRGRLRLQAGDLCQREWIFGLISQVRPDYIFHLAAQAFVPRAWTDPWGTLENNIRGQLNLLEAVVAGSTYPRILIAGSGDEYGIVHPEELPISEDNPLRPYNPYAVSKVAQDLLGYQYYLSHSLPLVRVRPFNHLGPRQRPSFVAAAFAKQIAEAEQGLRAAVVKVGNLDARRDFTDVRDIVRGYWLALEKGEPGEVYNLGSEKAHSIAELLDTLLELSNVELEIQVDPSRARPSEIPVVISDCRKFQERTGWKPTISFPQSVQAVLDYWREETQKERKQNPIH